MTVLPAKLILKILMGLCLLLAACGSRPQATGTDTLVQDAPLLVLGVYGTSAEEPWNNAIHRAMLAAEADGAIRYTFMDEIGFTGDLAQVLRTAIVETEPAIIVGDAFGREAAVTAVAQEHPEIAFVFGSDEEPGAPNLSVFDSWIYEPAYLAGMLAGGMTRSNIVGIVAGYPEGSVNRSLNAFIAGANTVNPEAEVRIEFINSWFDPQAAAHAAKTFVADGADVLFGERSGVIEVAAAEGVYAIGNMIDQGDEAPDSVLSSVIWDMGPAMEHVIGQVRNSRYTGQDLADFSTLAVGGARLAPLNQEVRGGIPQELQAQIKAKAAEIVSGRFVVPVDDRNPARLEKAVVLGALYNLTGEQSELDISSAQGAQLAVAEVNEAGGVLGRPVALVVEDGQTDPAVLAEKTADILAQHPDVVAFLGLSDTDMVLGAAPVAAAAERPFLTSGATSPLLPEQVPHYLFLACFGDNVQAAAAAEWAYDALSARTAAVLSDATMQYTQGLESYFVARFTELGGDIVAAQSYATGDLHGLAQAVSGLTEADMIFVAAGPEDAPEAARLLRQAGFTAPIVGGDGFDSGPLWQKHAEIKDVYFTTHAYLGADNPNPAVQAFRRAYLAQYPNAEPNAFTALGYDAARLLLTAVEAADSTAPEDIVSALSSVRTFEGVTGSLSFIPGNPIPVKAVTILAVEAGSYRFVAELTPQSVPQPDP